MNNEISDTWKHAIVDLPCRSEGLMASQATATDCITSYRRSLLTMSQAAAAALIVRGAPTEDQPSRTWIATAVVVVIRWKLSTVVSVSMTVAILVVNTNQMFK